MNCIRCNEPLLPDARFCRNCGAPASISDPVNSYTPTIASSQPNLTPQMRDALTFSTMPVQEAQSPQMEQTQQTQQAWIPAQQTPQQKWILPEPQAPQAPQPSQIQASAQQPYYQPTVPAAPGTLQSTGIAGQRSQAFATGQYVPVTDLPPRRRGRRLRITLITLVVIIAVLAGGWILGLRPYLHSLAQDQLDSALSSAVNQMNLSSLPQVPAGVPILLKIREDAVNNLYLPLVQAPSSPVQNMRIQITSNEIQLDFTVYGFASNITGRPTLINGNLVVTNVSVGGIAGLVMSSDEMTALLNKHLADAQTQLHRPISQILLLNHELDIILG